MQETTNYKMPKYESADPPNLETGYNVSMDILDAQLKTTNKRIDDIALPDGFTEFVKALGLTKDNATKLGAMLNHQLLKVKATNFTTKNLAEMSVTAEGLTFIPDAS